MGQISFGDRGIIIRFDIRDNETDSDVPIVRFIPNTCTMEIIKTNNQTYNIKFYSVFNNALIANTMVKNNQYINEREFMDVLYDLIKKFSRKHNDEFIFYFDDIGKIYNNY